MEVPLVSLVILSYPGREKVLVPCLTSTQNSDYPHLETTLVSNGYDPAFSNKINRWFPAIKIIWLPANTGCFGFSVGYANAKGQYILSLDDDTTINPDTVRRIVSVFGHKSRKVMVLSLNALNPKTNHHYASSSTVLTSFQAGSVAFKRELFSKIGFYDEDFFLWGEEDDYALRVLDARYQIDFEESIVVNHFERTGAIRKKQILSNARNKVWLNIKHFSLRLLPLLVFRDLAWVCLLPYRKKSLLALFYGLIGYLQGYLSFFIPLKKRRVVSWNVQKKFIRHYWLSDLKRCRIFTRWI